MDPATKVPNDKANRKGYARLSKEEIEQIKKESAQRYTDTSWQIHRDSKRKSPLKQKINTSSNSTQATDTVDSNAKLGGVKTNGVIPNGVIEKTSCKEKTETNRECQDIRIETTEPNYEPVKRKVEVQLINKRLLIPQSNNKMIDSSKEAQESFSDQSNHENYQDVNFETSKITIKHPTLPVQNPKSNKTHRFIEVEIIDTKLEPNNFHLRRQLTLPRNMFSETRERFETSMDEIKKQPRNVLKKSESYSEISSNQHEYEINNNQPIIEKNKTTSLPTKKFEGNKNKNIKTHRFIEIEIKDTKLEPNTLLKRQLTLPEDMLSEKRKRIETTETKNMTDSGPERILKKSESFSGTTKLEHQIIDNQITTNRNIVDKFSSLPATKFKVNVNESPKIQTRRFIEVEIKDTKFEPNCSLKRQNTLPKDMFSEKRKTIESTEMKTQTIVNERTAVKKFASLPARKTETPKIKTRRFIEVEIKDTKLEPNYPLKRQNTLPKDMFSEKRKTIESTELNSQIHLDAEKILKKSDSFSGSSKLQHQIILDEKKAVNKFATLPARKTETPKIKTRRFIEVEIKDTKLEPNYPLKRQNTLPKDMFSEKRKIIESTEINTQTDLIPEKVLKKSESFSGSSKLQQQIVIDERKAVNKFATLPARKTETPKIKTRRFIEIEIKDTKLEPNYALKRQNTLPKDMFSEKRKIIESTKINTQTDLIPEKVLKKSESFSGSSKLQHQIIVDERKTVNKFATLPARKPETPKIKTRRFIEVEIKDTKLEPNYALKRQNTLPKDMFSEKRKTIESTEINTQTDLIPEKVLKKSESFSGSSKLQQQIVIDERKIVNKFATLPARKPETPKIKTRRFIEVEIKDTKLEPNYALKRQNTLPKDMFSEKRKTIESTEINTQTDLIPEKILKKSESFSGSSKLQQQIVIDERKIVNKFATLPARKPETPKIKTRRFIEVEIKDTKLEPNYALKRQNTLPKDMFSEKRKTIESTEINTQTDLIPEKILKKSESFSDTSKLQQQIIVDERKIVNKFTTLPARKTETPKIKTRRFIEVEIKDTKLEPNHCLKRQNTLPKDMFSEKRKEIESTEIKTQTDLGAEKNLKKWESFSGSSQFQHQIKGDQRTLFDKFTSLPTKKFVEKEAPEIKTRRFIEVEIKDTKFEPNCFLKRQNTLPKDMFSEKSKKIESLRAKSESSPERVLKKSESFSGVHSNTQIYEVNNNKLVEENFMNQHSSLPLANSYNLNPKINTRRFVEVEVVETKFEPCVQKCKSLPSFLRSNSDVSQNEVPFIENEIDIKNKEVVNKSQSFSESRIKNFEIQPVELNQSLIIKNDDAGFPSSNNGTRRFIEIEIKDTKLEPRERESLSLPRSLSNNFEIKRESDSTEVAATEIHYNSQLKKSESFSEFSTKTIPVKGGENLGKRSGIKNKYSSLPNENLRGRNASRYLLVLQDNKFEKMGRCTSEVLHTHDEAAKNGKGLNKMLTSNSYNGFGTLTSQPRSGRNGNSAMDLSYVTERIISIWFPPSTTQHAYRQGQSQAAHMLRSKYGDNYMVFNLSEPKRALRNEHKHVKEVGWPQNLAPPLEKLCSVCKEIDSWLSGDQHRIAVLHARGNKDKLGVIVAAYMHYSNICGSAEQALDRFSMRKFLDDNIGPLNLPSNKRYVDYFAGLLSHNIKIKTAPLYLTHVTVLGAPNFHHGGCKAFLKLFEGHTSIYTSGVYSVSGGVRQFTVNVAGERRRGLQLRGDILVKCYHRGDLGRETVFACQFHTCAVADYTLSFTRQELDFACNDHRFPVDGAIELHFSPGPEGRLPAPAPTPAVPFTLASDDPVVRAESPLQLEEEEDDEEDTDSDDVNHTFGPLDGSIYATIAKKPELSPGAVSSPLTVSMDSGISSAGHQQNANTNASASPPPTAQPSPLTPEEQHRQLDKLLSDMLLTVESIPDAKPQQSRDVENVRYIDEEEDRNIPYHARQDSRPFTYGVTSNTMITESKGLSSPSLVRKASVNKSSGDTLKKVQTQVYPDYSSKNLSNYQTNSYNSYNDNTLSKYSNYSSSSFAREKDPIDDIFTASALSANQPIKREFREGFYREDVKRYDPLKRSLTEGTLKRSPEKVVEYKSSSVVTSPYSDSESLSPPGAFRSGAKSPEFHETYVPQGNLTWLQRQQLKLKERREMQLREERHPHEFRLLSELRQMQGRHMRPTASHRLDGYTSDTTAFADDDDDYTIPLHINTKSARAGSAKERPFMAVKRAHENYSQNANPASILAANPLGQVVRAPSRSGDLPDGLLSLVEQEGQYKGRYQNSNSSYREESWRSQSVNDVESSPSHSSSPRPQTPAFPVHARTPYMNASTPTVQFADLPSERLPPKSPTTQRKDRPTSPTDLTNGVSESIYQTTHRSVSATPPSFYRDNYSENYQHQHSPKSPSQNGSSSPTVYYGNSRRSSIHSNSEPPQEVSPAHVKFVRDTSSYWYKPAISREEAISMLRDQPPGTFVVRDSNSFPGAFGMALKVAMLPSNVQPKSNNSDELVRHFLIEPTSKGVRLKGCQNEPVFSSLSALVYQHSVTQMALPCRLLLPSGDLKTAAMGSPAQQVLNQGAACNVIYLFSYEMESLTGPQAVKKSVLQLLQKSPTPETAVVHFKVNGQGITLTDNKRKLFFRRHYPINTISHCGLDPDEHRWNVVENGEMPKSPNRIFGFVARKPGVNNPDNQCHLFAELELEQPATAIVNFVNKVLTSSGIKPNIV